MFESVYNSGSQINFFQRIVAYFISAYVTQLRFTVLTKKRRGDHKRWLSIKLIGAEWHNTTEH